MPRLQYALPLALGLATGLSAPARAIDYACGFERECVAGEACGASGFDIVLTEGADGTYVISSLSGDNAFHPLGDPARLPLSFAAADATGAGLAELLTIEADGTAIFSVHVFDETPLAVSYFGRCEAVE